jgi:hypothetical protein
MIVRLEVFQFGHIWGEVTVLRETRGNSGIFVFCSNTARCLCKRGAVLTRHLCAILFGLGTIAAVGPLLGSLPSGDSKEMSNDSLMIQSNSGIQVADSANDVRIPRSCVRPQFSRNTSWSSARKADARISVEPGQADGHADRNTFHVNRQVELSRGLGATGNGERKAQRE